MVSTNQATWVKPLRHAHHRVYFLIFLRGQRLGSWKPYVSLRQVDTDPDLFKGKGRRCGFLLVLALVLVLVLPVFCCYHYDDFDYYILSPLLILHLPLFFLLLLPVLLLSIFYPPPHIGGLPWFRFKCGSSKGGLPAMTKRWATKLRDSPSACLVAGDGCLPSQLSRTRGQR